MGPVWVLWLRPDMPGLTGKRQNPSRGHMFTEQRGMLHDFPPLGL